MMAIDWAALIALTILGGAVFGGLRFLGSLAAIRRPLPEPVVNETFVPTEPLTVTPQEPANLLHQAIEELETLKSTMAGNVIAVFSAEEPPTQNPIMFGTARSVVWLQAIAGGSRVTLHKLTPNDMGDLFWEQMGTTKHAMFNNGQTLISIGTVTRPGIDKLINVINNFRRRDPLLVVKFTQLQGTWQKWLLECDPEDRQQIMGYLKIEDNYEAPSASPARRRIDLGD